MGHETDDEGPFWYALRVQRQKEFVAAFLLRKAGARTFVPTETRFRRRTRYGKSKSEFAVPIIPGCVFAGFDDEPAWYNVLKNTLIIGPEGMDGKPWRMNISGKGGLFSFFAASIDGCMELDRGLQMIHVQGKGLIRPLTTRVRTVAKRHKGEDVVVEPVGRRARLLQQFAIKPVDGACGAEENVRHAA